MRMLALLLSGWSAREDNQTTLIPFHFPVRGHGDLRHDKWLSQRRIQYRRSCGVSVWRLAPQVGVGSCRNCEEVHALRKCERLGQVDCRETASIGWHSIVFRMEVGSRLCLASMLQGRLFRSANEREYCSKGDMKQGQIILHTHSRKIGGICQNARPYDLLCAPLEPFKA